MTITKKTKNIQPRRPYLRKESYPAKAKVVNYLGVTFTNDLSWKKRIGDIGTEANTLAFLRRNFLRTTSIRGKLDPRRTCHTIRLLPRYGIPRRKPTRSSWIEWEAELPASHFKNTAIERVTKMVDDLGLSDLPEWPADSLISRKLWEVIPRWRFRNTTKCP